MVLSGGVPRPAVVSTAHICCVQTDGGTLGSSPKAAVTNDHECRGLAPHKHVGAQSQGPEVRRQFLWAAIEVCAGLHPFSERWERLPFLVIFGLPKAPFLVSSSSSTFRPAVASL